MKKWEIKSQALAALAAFFMMSFLNLPFWRFVWQRLTISDFSDFLFALNLPLCLFLFLYACISLFLWPYVGKTLLAVLLLASAAATYFMYNLGVLVDSEMLRNVLETNPREAGEMFTPGGALWMLILGVIPVVLLFRTRIAYRPFWREIGVRLVHILVASALAIGMGIYFYKDYSSTVRNNKMVGKILCPSNYISATISYVKKKLRANRVFQIIDSHPDHIPYEDPYYTVVVIVVGETARAANFSLYGYGRNTNPLLAKQDIIRFRNVTSSGTATAFSVPCMFSQLPRGRFNVDDAANSENLLDVMKKAGYDVLWRDNDGGSKGVSDRVQTENLYLTGNAKYKNGDTYFDEVLLDGLEEKLNKLNKDTVIILHMMGSHGPSYYKRYPNRFKVFTPTCDTAEIQNSPQEEIVNTYDNTILYTDFVLSKAIDILKKYPHYEAGLLYVSDHGESLGENGLYLHGLPYAIAPQEQKQIPMLLWMSETMKREDHVDYKKLRAASDTMVLSHDNLFHSVLGLVEVKSDLYDPNLDLFRDFRTKKLPYQ